MSVLEYIILSFALTVPVMVTLRACALKNPIRLTRGLGVSFLVAIVHVLLILAGIYIGNLLRFELPEYDSLIYLGLLVVVALRMFFPAFRKKEKELPAYDISRWLTVLLLGIATGTNTFFVGPNRQEHPRPSLAAYRSPLPARFCHQRRLLCRLNISQYIRVRYTCRKHVILEAV